MSILKHRMAPDSPQRAHHLGSIINVLAALYQHWLSIYLCKEPSQTPSLSQTTCEMGIKNNSCHLKKAPALCWVLSIWSPV